MNGCLCFQGSRKHSGNKIPPYIIFHYIFIKLDKLDSTKYPNTMLGANVSNVPDCEEATKNGYIDASDAQIRTYEAKHYFYPIPTTQLTLNKNMKQNPGW